MTSGWGLPSSLTGGPSAATARSFLLGLLALREGLLDRDQLQKALLKQGELRRFGRHARLGEVFVRLGYLDEARLAEFLELRAALLDHGLSRVPLGLRVVMQGWATPSQVLEALEAREAQGVRLGELMVQRGWITPAQLEALLAEQAADHGDDPADEGARWLAQALS
jgi:hypothetical protein